MDGYLLTPVEFVLRTLFELYILLVMLRFLLQWVRADFYNPVSQFVVKMTTPPLRPLRRIIPGVAGLDMASLSLAFLLQLIKIAIVGAAVGGLHLPGLISGTMVPFGSLLLLALVDLVSLLFNIFIFAILIQAILSWFNPGHYNPVTALLYTLTDPVLKHARRLLPPISGIDLSPLLALMALQVLKMLLIPPLLQLAL